MIDSFGWHFIFSFSFSHSWSIFRRPSSSTRRSRRSRRMIQVSVSVLMILKWNPFFRLADQVNRSVWMTLRDRLCSIVKTWKAVGFVIVWLFAIGSSWHRNGRASTTTSFLRRSSQVSGEKQPLGDGWTILYIEKHHHRQQHPSSCRSHQRLWKSNTDLILYPSDGARLSVSSQTGHFWQYRFESARIHYTLTRTSSFLYIFPSSLFLNE